ncbi:MAG TPA: hypothetical protein VME45_10100 [Stellaceae bacterium]|nr:hypothetical protein [Stellaceae bacterium]
MIVRQRANLNPCIAPLVNGVPQSLQYNFDSRGCFQYQLICGPHSVQDISGKPFKNGVTLLGYAPVTAPGSQGFPIQYEQAMTLYGSTGDGTGNLPFTAQVNDQINLDGWGVSDLSSTSQTLWDFHEVASWDPTENTPNNFINWWQNMYDPNNNNSVFRSGSNTHDGRPPRHGYDRVNPMPLCLGGIQQPTHQVLSGSRVRHWVSHATTIARG